MRSSKLLEINGLDGLLRPFRQATTVVRPSAGWIAAFRSALNMTRAQLGKRLGITGEAVRQTELREAEGNITLATLRDFAEGLGGKVVYAIVPERESVEVYAREQARTLAEKIVLRTHRHMELEAQQVREDSLRQAIEETTEELLRVMDRKIWN